MSVNTFCVNVVHQDYCFYAHMQGSITVYFNYIFLELSFVTNGW